MTNTCLTCRHADMKRAIAQYGHAAQSAYCNAPGTGLQQQCTTYPLTWECDKGKWQQAAENTIAARQKRLKGGGK